MKPIVLLTLLAIALSVASAAQVQWTSATGGDFDNPALWSTGTVPTSSDDIVISTCQDDEYSKIVIDQAFTVASVILGGDASGCLPPRLSFTRGRQLSVSNMTWYSGIMYGSGSIPVSDTFRVATTANKSIEAKTKIIVNPNANFIMENASSFAIGYDSRVSVSNGGVFTVTGDATITSLSSTAHIWTVGDLVIENGAVFDIQVELKGDGLVSINNGTLIINDGGYLAGTLSLGSTSTLDVAQPLEIRASGSVEGDGECIVRSTINVLGEFRLSGDVTMDGGYLVFKSGSRTVQLNLLDLPNGTNLVYDYGSIIEANSMDLHITGGSLEISYGALLYANEVKLYMTGSTSEFTVRSQGQLSFKSIYIEDGVLDLRPTDTEFIEVSDSFSLFGGRVTSDIYFEFASSCDVVIGGGELDVEQDFSVPISFTGPSTKTLKQQVRIYDQSSFDFDGVLIVEALELHESSFFLNSSANIIANEYLLFAETTKHYLNNTKLTLSGYVRFQGDMVLTDNSYVDSTGESRVQYSDTEVEPTKPLFEIHDTSVFIISKIKDSIIELSVDIVNSTSVFKIDNAWSLWTVQDLEVNGLGQVWLNSIDNFVVKSPLFVWEGDLYLTSNTKVQFADFTILEGEQQFPHITVENEAEVQFTDRIEFNGAPANVSLDVRSGIVEIKTNTSSLILTDTMTSNDGHVYIYDMNSITFNGGITHDITSVIEILGSTAPIITFNDFTIGSYLDVKAIVGGILGSSLRVIETGSLLFESEVGEIDLTLFDVIDSAQVVFNQAVESFTIQDTTITSNNSKALRLDGTLSGDFDTKSILVQQGTVYFSGIAGKFRVRNTLTLNNQGRINVQGVGSILIETVTIADPLSYCWFIRSIETTASFGDVSISGYNSQLFVAGNKGLTFGSLSLESSSKLVVAGDIDGLFKVSNGLEIGSDCTVQVLGSVTGNFVVNKDLSGEGYFQVRGSAAKFIVGGTFSLAKTDLSTLSHINIHEWTFHNPEFDYETISSDFVVDIFTIDAEGSTTFDNIDGKVVIKSLTCALPHDLTINGGLTTFISNTASFSGQCSLSLVNFGDNIQYGGSIDIESLFITSQGVVELPTVTTQSLLSVTAKSKVEFKSITSNGQCQFDSPEIYGQFSSSFTILDNCEISGNGELATFDVERTDLILNGSLSISNYDSVIFFNTITEDDSASMTFSDLGSLVGGSYDFIGSLSFDSIDSIVMEEISIMDLVSTNVTSFTCASAVFSSSASFAEHGAITSNVGGITFNGNTTIFAETLVTAGTTFINNEFTGIIASFSLQSLLINAEVSLQATVVTVSEQLNVSSPLLLSNISEASTLGAVSSTASIQISCLETGTIAASSFSFSDDVTLINCQSFGAGASVFGGASLIAAGTDLSFGSISTSGSSGITARSIAMADLVVFDTLSLTDVTELVAEDVTIGSDAVVSSSIPITATLDSLSLMGTLTGNFNATVGTGDMSGIIDNCEFTFNDNIVSSGNFALDNTTLTVNAKWNTAMCTIPMGIGSTVSIAGDMISTCGSAFKFDGPQSALEMSGSFTGADLSSMVIDSQIEFSGATITLLTASQLTLSGYSEDCGAAHIIAPSLTVPIIVENSQSLCIGATSTLSLPTSSAFKALSDSELIYGGFVPNQPTFSTNEGVIRLQGTATYDSVTVDDLFVATESALHFTNTIPAFPHIVVEGTGTIGLHDVSFETNSLSVSGSLVSNSEAEITTPEFACEGCSCVGNITIIAETVSIDGNALFDGCVVQVSDTFALSESSELTGANNAHILLTESASDLTLKSVSLPVSDGNATFEFSSTLTLDTVEMDWTILAHGDVSLIDNSTLNGGGEFEGIFEMADDISVSLGGVDDYIFTESSRIVGDTVDFAVGGSGAKAYVNGYYGLNPNMTFEAADMTFTETAVVAITSLVVDGGVVEVAQLDTEDIAKLTLVKAMNGGKIVFKSLPCPLDIEVLDLTGEVVFENLTYPISLGTLVLKDAKASFSELPPVSFGALQLDNTTFNLSTGHDVNITNLQMIGPSELLGTDTINIVNFDWQGGVIGSANVFSESTLTSTSVQKGLIEPCFFTGTDMFMIGDASVTLTLEENSVMRYEANMSFGSPIVNFLAPTTNSETVQAGTLEIATTALAFPLESYFEVNLIIEGNVVVNDDSAQVWIEGNVTILGSLTFLNTATFKFSGDQFLLEDSALFTGPETIVELEPLTNTIIRGQFVCYPVIAISNATITYDGAVFTLSTLTLVDDAHGEFRNLGSEADIELSTVNVQDSSLVFTNCSQQIDIVSFMVLQSFISATGMLTLSVTDANIQYCDVGFDCAAGSSVTAQDITVANSALSINVESLSMTDVGILSSDFALKGTEIDIASIVVDGSNSTIEAITGTLGQLEAVMNSSLNFLGNQFTMTKMSLLGDSTTVFEANLSGDTLQLQAGSLLNMSGSLDITTFIVDYHAIQNFNGANYLVNTLNITEQSVLMVQASNMVNVVSLNIASASLFETDCNDVTLADVLVSDVSQLALNGNGPNAVGSIQIDTNSLWTTDGSTSLTVSALTVSSASLLLTDISSISIISCYLSETSVMKILDSSIVTIPVLSSNSSSIAITTETGLPSATITGTTWNMYDSPVVVSQMDNLVITNYYHDGSTMSIDNVLVGIDNFVTSNMEALFQLCDNITINSFTSSNSQVSLNGTVGQISFIEAILNLDSSLNIVENVALSSLSFDSLSLSESGLASDDSYTCTVREFVFISGVLNTIDVVVTDSILLHQIGSKILSTASLTADCDGSFAHDSIYGTPGSVLTISSGRTITLDGAVNFMLYSDNSLEDELPHLILDGTMTRTAGITDIQMAFYLEGSSTGSFIATTSTISIFAAEFDGILDLSDDALLLINGVVTFGPNSIISSTESFLFTSLSDLTIQGQWDLPSTQAFTTGTILFDGAHIKAFKSLDINNTIVEIRDVVCDDCALDRLMMVNGQLIVDTISAISIDEFSLYSSEVSLNNIDTLGAFGGGFVRGSVLEVTQPLTIASCEVQSWTLICPELVVVGELKFDSGVQKQLENDTIVRIQDTITQIGAGAVVAGDNVQIIIEEGATLNLSSTASFGVADGCIATLENHGSIIKGADTGSTTIRFNYEDFDGSSIEIGANSDLMFNGDVTTHSTITIDTDATLSVGGQTVTFASDSQLLGVEGRLNMMGATSNVNLMGEYSLHPDMIVRAGTVIGYAGSVLNLDSITIVNGSVILDGVTSDETNFTLTYVDVIAGSLTIQNISQPLEVGAMQVRSGSLHVIDAQKDVFITSTLAILGSLGELEMTALSGELFINSVTLRGSVEISSVTGLITLGTFSVLDSAVVGITNVHEIITGSTGLTLGSDVRVEFEQFDNILINGPIVTGDDAHLVFETFDNFDVAGPVTFSDRTSVSIHDVSGRVYFAKMVSGQTDVDISIDDVLGSVEFNNSVNIVEKTYFGVASTPLLAVRLQMNLGPDYEVVFYNIDQVSIGESLRVQSSGEAHIEQIGLMSLQNLILGDYSALNITKTTLEVGGTIQFGNMAVLSLESVPKFALAGALVMDGTCVVSVTNSDLIEFQNTVTLGPGSIVVFADLAELYFADAVDANGSTIEIQRVSTELMFNSTVYLYNTELKISDTPGTLEFVDTVTVGNFAHLLTTKSNGILLSSVFYLDEYGEFSVLNMTGDVVFLSQSVFLGNTTIQDVDDVYFSLLVDILGSFRLTNIRGSAAFMNSISCGDSCDFDLINVGDDVYIEGSFVSFAEGIANISTVTGEVLINGSVFINDYSTFLLTNVSGSVGISENFLLDYDSSFELENVTGDVILSEDLEAYGDSNFVVKHVDGAAYLRNIYANDSSVTFNDVVGCVHVLETVNTVDGYFEISDSPCVEVTGKVYSSSEIVFEGITGWANFSDIEFYGDVTFDSIGQIYTNSVYVPGRWVMKNVTKKIIVEETFVVAGDVRFINVTVVDISYVNITNGTTQFTGEICSTLPELNCDNCSLGLGPFPSDIPEQCLEDNAVRCPADDPFCNLPGFPPNCPEENGVNPYCPVCPSNRTECGGTESPCMDEDVTYEEYPECFEVAQCVDDPEHEDCIEEAACPDSATEETHPDCFVLKCPADATPEDYPDCFETPCPDEATIETHPDCFNEPECTTESTNEECMIEAKCPGDDPDCTVDPECAAGDTEGDCGVAPFCDRYPNSTECQPQAPICPGPDERCTVTAECKYANGSLDYSKEECLVTGKCVGDENLDNPECLLPAECPDPNNPLCTSDSWCDTYPDDEECVLPPLCGVNGSLYGTDEYNDTCTDDICNLDPENELCQPIALCDPDLGDPTNENCQVRPLCKVDPDNELCQYTPLCSDPDNLANHEDCQYQALCESQPDHENCQATPVCSLEANDSRILADPELAAQYSTLCEWQPLCEVDPDHLYCKWRPLCLADPENELCQWHALCEVDPDNAFCQWTPTCLSDPDSLLCQSRPLCLVNPEHENCQWTWLCDEEPDHAFCKNRSLCYFNPDHENCQYRYICDVFPNHTLCVHTRFCAEHPYHITCDPEFCNRNPYHWYCGSQECVTCPDAGEDVCGPNPCENPEDDPDKCMWCGIPLAQPKTTRCRWVSNPDRKIKWSDWQYNPTIDPDTGEYIENTETRVVGWPPLVPAMTASAGSVTCDNDDGCNVGNLVAEKEAILGGTKTNVSTARFDNAYVESNLEITQQLEVVGQPSAFFSEVVSNGETILDSAAIYGDEGGTLTTNGNTTIDPSCVTVIKPFPSHRTRPKTSPPGRITRTRWCQTHYCGGHRARCRRYCGCRGCGSSGGSRRCRGSHCSSHTSSSCVGCGRTRYPKPSPPTITIIC